MLATLGGRQQAASYKKALCGSELARDSWMSAASCLLQEAFASKLPPTIYSRERVVHLLYVVVLLELVNKLEHFLGFVFA